ncbi:uncharacterized protein BO80DRAFT_428296 [Aspergillus ibericus CBS 121593]|uniref:Uncharacterized protein n=1 Tax=Aspergillus ibericus CBS 121593 TaxID=1448316 RepID=A0A395GTN2_9EURO|nr:hypothetical protein BO80DRAFT_428296 [Aspergillus ibericus CBS 121593]RAK97453.1 hypothetical protein BO80DRAFT_428296 [Aspergillus ibericus CBS 121593]
MRRNFCSAVETHLFLSIDNKDYAAPPSWIEEYRTHWALWHLRHYSDLQNLALNHITSQCCTTIVEKLETYTTWNGLVNNDSPMPRVEEIWTLAAVLTDLGLHVSYGFFKHEPNEPLNALWDLPQETPLPLIPFSNLPPQAMNYPVWCPSPVPNVTKINDTWDRIVQDPSFPSLVSMFFRSQVYDMLMARRRTATCMEDMRPYRRLGMCIWDAWRVYSAGLLSFRCVGMIPTPTGGFVEPSRPGLHNVRKMQIRWAALIGKDV